ncbi:MAG: hypothetical protein AABZ23_01130 [Deltaproteobacteria bacterium]
MGIYFIAAGISSKNREISLDKGFKLDELWPFINKEGYNRLKEEYSTEDLIYIWGANERSIKQLSLVQKGEYIVDVMNKQVKQIFIFSFYMSTEDKNLQNFIGWDKEKPDEKRRPFHYVFFLKNPRKIKRTLKNYFESAFSEDKNPHWLAGQKYFDDVRVKEAIEKTSTKNIEEFLGI